MPTLSRSFDRERDARGFANAHNDLLNVDEASEMLRCSKGLVYEMLRDGRLRGVKIGRRRLITLAEVENLIANGHDRRA